MTDETKTFEVVQPVRVGGRLRKVGEQVALTAAQATFLARRFVKPAEAAKPAGKRAAAKADA